MDNQGKKKKKFKVKFLRDKHKLLHLGLKKYFQILEENDKSNVSQQNETW